MTESPQLPAGLTLPPSPNITEEDLDRFDQDDPEKVAAPGAKAGRGSSRLTGIGGRPLGSRGAAILDDGVAPASPLRGRGLAASRRAARTAGGRSRGPAPRAGSGSAGRAVPARRWPRQDPAPRPPIPARPGAVLALHEPLLRQAARRRDRRVRRCAARKACPWPSAAPAAGTSSSPFNQTKTRRWSPGPGGGRPRTRCSSTTRPSPRGGRSRGRCVRGRATKTTNPPAADDADDEPESEIRRRQLGLFDRNLDPTSLRLWHAREQRPARNEGPAQAGAFAQGPRNALPGLLEPLRQFRRADAGQPRKLLGADPRLARADERLAAGPAEALGLLRQPPGRRSPGPFRQGIRGPGAAPPARLFPAGRRDRAA